MATEIEVPRDQPEVCPKSERKVPLRRIKMSPEEL